MKRFLTIIALSLLVLPVFSQAKKPTLMVVPSDQWCNKNGYGEMVDNQGVEVFVPSYKKALIGDDNLKSVITAINGLMQDRGFTCQDLEATVASLNNQDAELSAFQSKSGAQVQTNQIMQLRQRARADIILELSWIVEKLGPKNAINYTLRAVDSYTNKQVASSTGTGEPSFTASVSSLLAEAVNSHIEEFCERLQNHFDDLFANGREITININVFENAEGINLETEFGGKELREIIEDWVNDNTVSHRFSLAASNEAYMQFTDVRIPMYDDNGRAQDAGRYIRGLVNFLKGAPCNIQKIKRDNAGLGTARLIIGDK